MANISRNPAAGDRGAPRPGPGHRYRLGDIELAAIVRSHGWWSLAPFEWDEDRACLQTATIINERPVSNRPDPIRNQSPGGGLGVGRSRTSLTAWSGGCSGPISI